MFEKDPAKAGWELPFSFDDAPHALGPFILSPGGRELTPSERIHEGTHVQQFTRNPFGWLYNNLTEPGSAYTRPSEQEAYAAEPDQSEFGPRTAAMMSARPNAPRGAYNPNGQSQMDRLRATIMEGF